MSGAGGRRLLAWIMLLVAAAMVVLAAACGGGGDDTELTRVITPAASPSPRDPAFTYEGEPAKPLTEFPVATINMMSPVSSDTGLIMLIVATRNSVTGFARSPS